MEGLHWRLISSNTSHSAHWNSNIMHPYLFLSCRRFALHFRLMPHSFNWFDLYWLDTLTKGWCMIEHAVTSEALDCRWEGDGGDSYGWNFSASDITTTGFSMNLHMIDRYFYSINGVYIACTNWKFSSQFSIQEEMTQLFAMKHMKCIFNCNGLSFLILTYGTDSYLLKWFLLVAMILTRWNDPHLLRESSLKWLSFLKWCFLISRPF